MTVTYIRYRSVTYIRNVTAYGYDTQCIRGLQKTITKTVEKGDFVSK